MCNSSDYSREAAANVTRFYTRNGLAQLDLSGATIKITEGSLRAHLEMAYNAGRQELQNLDPKP
jgi:hypothetical protein